MASNKEVEFIVPGGGLNLLTPPDKVQPGGSLLQDNWRVDQSGELRTRWGIGQIAGPIGSGNIHSLARFANNRYGGVGAGVYWGNQLQTLVSSGLDGTPFEMVYYLGSAWLMNTGKQLRIQGSSSYNWGIAAPASAPTATPGAQLFTGLEEFDGPALPSGFDGGYYNGNTWVDSPVTLQSEGAQVIVALGATAVVSPAKAFTSGLAGLFMTFVTVPIPFGVPQVFTMTVQTYVSPSLIILSAPWPGPSGIAVAEAQVSLPCYSIDTANVANVEYASTGSLSCVASPAAPWTIKDAFASPIDTRTNGVAQDDDVFRLWFKVDTPSAVQSITVTLFSGAYPTTSASQAATINVAPELLKAYSNGWSLLQALRNVNIDNWNKQIGATTDATQISDLQAELAQRLSQLHFTGIQGGVTYTNFQQAASAPQALYSQPGHVTAIDWSKISGLEIQVLTTAPCQFWVDSVHFVGTIQGQITGSGEYFVSFVNGLGYDGNLSPQSNTITCQGQSVALSGIPVSPDPQVTQRWIWRTGFGSSQTLKVGTINDNLTTVFVDTLTTIQAQDIGVTAPTNRTLPPAASGCMGPYLSRIIVWGTAANPARYYWSPPGQPWYFPGADEVDGNWEDAGSSDDPLLMITNHQLMSLFYKARSLGRLYSDPDSADYETVDTTVGLVGSKAVANGGLYDYFMGPEGIYRRDYDSKVKISGDIDPIFKGDYVMLSIDGSGNYETIPPISTTWIGNSVIEICNDRLYVSYTEQGQSSNNITLVCQLPGATAITDVPTYRWFRYKVNVSNISGAVPGFTALHYEGNPFPLMGGITGSAGGYLEHIDFVGSVQDNSQPIHVAWMSRFMNQGLPDNEKYYSDIEVDCQTAFQGQGASSLSVYVVYDNSNKVLLGTVTTATRSTTPFSLLSLVTLGENLRAKNIAIRIEGDVSSTCILYGVYLHWYPQERIALTFDSGFTDLGQPERVKQVDYIELYATGTGQVLNRALLSDLPGGVLVGRDNTLLTLPNGRGTVRQRLAEIVEGRNYQCVLNAGTVTPFQLHALRLRQRVVGEYIDGTIGEYWESPEFSVAPGRDAELKDLLLDYDSSGAGGQLVLYSDSNPPPTDTYQWAGQVVTLSISNAGGSYLQGDVVTLGSGGCTVRITGIGGGGSVATWTILTPGLGYSISSGFAATGGSGLNLSFNIIGIGSGGLAPVRTLAIPAGPRRTFTFAFEDAFNNLPYGTLFKARIFPPSNGILRLHGRAMLRARMIGVFFDGSAGEQWLTQPVDLFGGMAQVREVSIVAQTGGPTGGQMTFTMYSELPTGAVQPITSFQFQSPTSPGGRVPIYARLPGAAKGMLFQFQVTGGFSARIYEVKVFGRRMGTPGDDWHWASVPLEATPDEWRPIDMPVRQTPEEFTWIEIPVDAIG